MPLLVAIPAIAIILTVIYFIIQAENKGTERRRAMALNVRLQNERIASNAKEAARTDISEWRRQSSLPAQVYLTSIEHDGEKFVKVGISKNVDGKRTRQHERNGHTIIKTWKVPSAAIARAVEREVLDWAQGTTGFNAKTDAEYMEPLLPQGGYTELMKIDQALVIGGISTIIAEFTGSRVGAV